MTFSNVFKHITDGLWLLGGISAAADLSLDDFGPGAYEPCPREAENSRAAVSPAASPKERPCPARCSNS